MIWQADLHLWYVVINHVALMELPAKVEIE